MAKQSADQPDSADVTTGGKADTKKRKKLPAGSIPPGTVTYLAKLKTLLKDTVPGDVFDAAVKSARGHAGGKAKAANKADEPTQRTGVMVAYMLKPEEASALAGTMDGVDTAELHLTLAYLGDVADLPEDAAARAIAALSALAYNAPAIQIETTGVDRFEAEDTGSLQDVVYATVDDEGSHDNKNPWAYDLCYLRSRICWALCDVGLSPRSDYDEYVPHITLGYVEPDSEIAVTLPDLDMTLDTLTLMVAGNRTDFKLTGAMPMETGGMFHENIVELCASGQSSRLFNEVQAFADPPEWMPVLPKPGSYKHPSYGEILITEARNENFVSNFNDGVYQEKVPVDAEHETKLSGAVGWIDELRQNEDGSVDGHVEWTERGVSLIEADAYKYVSPEWYEAWTDPASGTTYDDVLIGAAITNRPFFKDKALRPLVASESAIAVSDLVMSGTGAESPALPRPSFTRYEFVQRAGSNQEVMAVAGTATGEGGADSRRDPIPPGSATMTEDASKRFAEMETRLAAEKTAREAAEAQSRELAETVKQISNDRRRERFVQEVMGKSDSNGTRYFGDPKQHVSLMETLADTVGEDSDAFKAYVAQQRSVAEAMKESPVLSAIGRDSGDTAPATALDRAEASARKMMAEDPTLTYPVALDRALTSDRELARQYIEEQRASK